MSESGFQVQPRRRILENACHTWAP